MDHAARWHPAERAETRDRARRRPRHWAGVGGHNARPHKFSSTRDVLRGGGARSQMHECADHLSRERSFQVPTPR